MIKSFMRAHLMRGCDELRPELRAWESIRRPQDYKQASEEGGLDSRERMPGVTVGLRGRELNGDGECAHDSCIRIDLFEIRLHDSVEVLRQHFDSEDGEELL